MSFFCAFGQLPIVLHIAKLEIEASALTTNSRPNLRTLGPASNSLRTSSSKSLSQPIPIASTPWKINRHTYLLEIEPNSFTFNYFTNSNRNKKRLSPVTKSILNSCITNHKSPASNRCALRIGFSVSQRKPRMTINSNQYMKREVSSQKSASCPQLWHPTKPLALGLRIGVKRNPSP